MPQIIVDNSPLKTSSQMLEKLEQATSADRLTNGEVAPFHDTLVKEYGRMRESQDNCQTAREQIAELAKAMAGWQRYLDSETLRLKGRTRRYQAVREYVRAAEDEQTGN